MEYFGERITVGINEIIKVEFSTFPNPTNTNLNVVLPGVSELLRLSLSNINGKEIIVKEFKTQAQLDVSTLPNGIYIIRIKGANVNLSRRVVLDN